MLHTETVEGTTLELLRNLEQEEMLSYSKIFWRTSTACIQALNGKAVILSLSVSNIFYTKYCLTLHLK